MASENPIENSRSQGRRRRWALAAVFAAMLFPIVFWWPSPGPGMEVQTAAWTVDGLRVSARVTNHGRQELTYSLGTIQIVHRGQPIAVGGGAGRGLQRLGPGESREIEVLFKLRETPLRGRCLLRATRYRPPDLRDNVFHWLSVRLPGAAVRQWFREHIGPNSVPVDSERFEVPSKKS